jgi:hypothetical protein
VTKGEERRIARLFSSEDWKLVDALVLVPEMTRLLMRLDASEDVRTDDKMRGGRQALAWLQKEAVIFAKKSVDNTEGME